MALSRDDRAAAGAAERYLAEGLERLGQGDPRAALERFEQAAALSPRDPAIDFYRGEAYRLGGDPASALTYLSRAAARKLQHPELSLRLGLTHSALGQYEQAAAHYRRALRHDPDAVVTLCNLANAISRLGRIDEAIEHYTRAAQLEPEFPVARKNLGLMLFSAGRFGEAAEWLQAAAERLPEDPNIAEKLAMSLSESGRLEDAIAHYLEILASDPDNSVALTNLGNLYYNVGRTSEALALFEKLAERSPECAVYGLHRGIALYSLDRYDEAAVAFDRALAASATCPMSRRLGVETVVGRIRLYQGMSLLLQGRLADGWDGYEYRWYAKEPQPRELRETQARVWAGEDIGDRRLFIFREQGIGDELMFASMFDEVIARTGRCIIQCNRRLQATFERSFPSAEIRPAAEGHEDWISLAAEMSADDYWIFSGSLPRLLRRHREQFPRRAAYLRADEASARAWRTRLDALGPGLKVGISWAGGTLKNGSEFRSIDLARWASLLGLEGIIPISLQYTDCAAEIAAFERDTGITITHWADAIDDYEQTINLVSELDLVLSVQTAIVHTAGALGKPTWVLLPRAQTNWRWFGHGSDCAWYPGTRLYCQDSTRDWDPVIEKVRRDLVEIVTTDQPNSRALRHFS